MPTPAEFLENLFGLSGQVAVVVGGTGVLGGALAEGLAAAGAAVVVAGNHAQRGGQRVAQIEGQGGQAAFLPVDVGRRDSIETLLAATLAARGRVDMLVNCAGVNSASDYFDVADDDWQRVLDVNLRGTHWGCQIFGARWPRPAAARSSILPASRPTCRCRASSPTAPRRPRS